MAYNWFQREILGYRPTRTVGSNSRRMWTRLSVILLVLIMTETIATEYGLMDGPLPPIVAVVTTLWAVTFFMLMVITIPFLAFQGNAPSPWRLFADALTSITLTILSFSMLYRWLQVTGPDGLVAHSAADNLYFSMVTFSTLGYGDFRPTESARLVAAFQSIIGDLHLGIFVGAAFYAADYLMSEQQAQDKRADKQGDDQHDE